jgi:hypothetical protein
MGLSGTKIGRFPLNPGYSRLIPHNVFWKKILTEANEGNEEPKRTARSEIESWQLPGIYASR